MPGDHVRLTWEGVKVDKAHMLRIVGGQLYVGDPLRLLSQSRPQTKCAWEIEEDRIITRTPEAIPLEARYAYPFRTIRTGRSANRNTRSATEPRKSRATPEWPWDAITMMSTPSTFASWQIASETGSRVSTTRT